MKALFARSGLWLAIFQFGWLLSPTRLAAAGFTLTPAAVSNTYTGLVTLQVTGLAPGDTVVVQKYLNVNANGVALGGVGLWQQFQLTDGQASVFHHGSTSVTNLDIPGDLDTVAGQITAQLYLRADFAQTIVGQYAYVLSSPSGAFSPITNLFSVTNFPYPQSISGSVLSNGTSTTLPYAAVLLSHPSDGGENIVGGAIADASGHFTIPAPPGNYSLLPFDYNFVANAATAPGLTLGANATVTSNPGMVPATQTISGKLVDSTTSAAVPGVLMSVQAQNGLLAVVVGDTNGNFAARVNPGQWKLQMSDQAAAFRGYVRQKSTDTIIDTTAGGVSGVTMALTKATAIFYGSVKDNLGNPLPGIDLNSSDNNGGNSQYGTDAQTDANGNYFSGTLGGDTWQIAISSGDQTGAFANYVYSQPSFQQNGGVNFSTGQAVLQNFTAILATNHIVGYVRDAGGSPIGGVGVNASATINGVDYSVHADTDNNGNYSLSVAGGGWEVSLNCGGGNDGLDNILGNGAYQCPNNQSVNIANADGTADFTVEGSAGAYQIDGHVLDNFGHPIANVNVYANDGQGGNVSAGTDNNGYYVLAVGNGNWDVSVDCGGLTSAGYGCVNDQHVNISNGNYDGLNFTVQSCGSLAITTASLPDGLAGTNYNFQLQNDGCNAPFTWSLTPGSLGLPPGLGISSSGLISGTPASAPAGGTTNYFSVRVTDGSGNAVDQLLSLAIYPAFSIAAGPLPTGNLGVPYSAQVLVSGGREFYNGSSPNGYGESINTLPPGLSLSQGVVTVSNAYFVISGTPTSAGTFPFAMGAFDADNNYVQRNYSITISGASLQITTSTLGPAFVGVPYTNQLQAGGGTPPYIWTVALGSQPLPSGFALSTNGILSGLPAAMGTNTFIARVTDSHSLTTTRSLTLVVNSRPVIQIPTVLHGVVTLTWSATTGQSYQPQYTTSLSQPNWTNLGGVVVATGVTATASDANGLGARRFYRVAVLP